MASARDDLQSLTDALTMFTNTIQQMTGTSTTSSSTSSQPGVIMGRQPQRRPPSPSQPLIMSRSNEPLESESKVGRPKTDVSIQEILALRALHYTWTKISEIMGISRSTLYRRLHDAGISTDDYSNISSAELDEVIKEIKSQFPNDGEVMLKGHLLRLGLKVTRQDLRDSIHRVDHANTVARRSTVVQRRLYAVACPNAVWHMDSHHKLIRWRFITHAAIDGFSRTILYVICANNNKADTVLTCFSDGVSKYGLPQRVRSDHGGENVEVWKYMIAAHGGDTSCIVTGSSTHNERIERLWRDVHRSVTTAYGDVFRSLESESLLDPLNEVDLYCLHFIYLPRIRKSLVEFQNSWNCHSISTEGSKTPHQLFFEGILASQDDEACAYTPMSGIQIEIESSDPVDVPPNTFLPCPELILQLQCIDPLATSTQNGKDLYRTAIHIIGDHLRRSCTLCNNN